MPRGGARTGAGRKAGSTDRAMHKINALRVMNATGTGPDKTPLAYMLAVMNDPSAKDTLRLQAAQAAAQAEAFRNQLLQGQYDYGLKVSQIGDQIALGAIRTGMQLDQQLNQANLGFYTQLGSIAAGIPTYRTS